jgi:hypothetical protein
MYILTLLTCSVFSNLKNKNFQISPKNLNFCIHVIFSQKRKFSPLLITKIYPYQNASTFQFEFAKSAHISPFVCSVFIDRLPLIPGSPPLLLFPSFHVQGVPDVFAIYLYSVSGNFPHLRRTGKKGKNHQSAVVGKLVSSRISCYSIFPIFFGCIIFSYFLSL